MRWKIVARTLVVVSLLFVCVLPVFARYGNRYEYGPWANGFLLTNPSADVIPVWDDSANKFIWSSTSGANITMADDAWIGLGAAGGRWIFDSTPTPDLVIGEDMDLRLQSQPDGTAIVDTTSIGTIEFYGDDNTASADEIAGQIEVIATGTWTDGAEDAKMVLNAANNGTLNTNQLVLATSGAIGFGDSDPNTLAELFSTTPYLWLQNTTHEDTDYGRESRITGRGQQSGGELSSLGEIEFAHDGAVDDTKGIITIATNNGTVLTDAITIDSVQRVGLGTTSPAWQLDLWGDDTYLNLRRSANTFYKVLGFQTGATADFTLGLRETGDSDLHVYSVGLGSDAMIIRRTTGLVELAGDLAVEDTIYDKTSTNIILSPIKEHIQTIGLAGGGMDNSFTSVANNTRQDITLSSIVPIGCDILDVTIECDTSVTGSGSTVVTFIAGTSAGGVDLCGSAEVDADGDLSSPASGTWPVKAKTTTAYDVVIGATPTANWDTLTAGEWSVTILYHDRAAVKAQKGL